MAKTRRKFDADFKEGAGRLVRETGKPIAQVAKDLGINEDTLGNWVNADQRRCGDETELGEDERVELARLRKENAELTMGRVLKRSVALWSSGRSQTSPRPTQRPGGQALWSPDDDERKAVTNCHLNVNASR